MLVFIIWVCFEKLKSNWNQTQWVKDTIGVLLYVNEVKDHVPSQGSSEVRLGEKCKIVNFFLKT